MQWSVIPPIISKLLLSTVVIVDTQAMLVMRLVV